MCRLGIFWKILMKYFTLFNNLFCRYRKKANFAR